jgi:hypothetical protein
MSLTSTLYELVACIFLFVSLRRNKTSARVSFTSTGTTGLASKALLVESAYLLQLQSFKYL